MQTTTRITQIAPAQTAARHFGGSRSLVTSGHTLRQRNAHVVRAKPAELPTPPGYERAEEFRVERVSFGYVV